MTPKVSICIPAFNSPDLFSRALRSIAEQDYRDYEIVVTDDSTDDSIEKIVKEYQDSLDIHYYKNQVRKGSPENWNYAVSLASGEFIKILHHDDQFTDKYSLAQFVKLLEDHPEVDLAFCSSINRDSQQTVVNIHAIEERDVAAISSNPTLLFHANLIGSPSATVYRRNVNLFFDPKLKWLVDIDFYIRLLSQNPRIMYAREGLVTILCGSGEQVTAEFAWNRKAEIFETLYVFNKFFRSGQKPDAETLKTVWGLLTKYHVVTIEDLQGCAPGLEIPKSVKSMLIYQKTREGLNTRLSTLLFFLYKLTRTS